MCGMNQRSELISLARIYCEHRSKSKNLSLARLSTLIFNHGARLARISQGADFTLHSYQKALGWFSNHWPTDLSWPADIPRPAPAPDSPAAEALQATQDAAKEQPALQMSAKGQIQKPAALCALLGIDLSIYYQATSQYAAGKSRMDQTPRKGSDLSALVAALALVGDCRFGHHKLAAQISMAMPGSALSQRLKPLLVIP